jgi:protein-disulfide isomerase
MKYNPKRVGEWWMRHLFLCLLLLAVGCRAQNPAPGSAELNRSIEKQVRSTFKLPPYIDVTVGERKPSEEFAGYDKVVVNLSYAGQTQTRELLVSKDNKTLFSVIKMDLTRDPQAEIMAKINLAGRPVRGNKDAKVTVVVFDDFQCPYCSRMHQTLNDVLKTYGDRIKLIYKDYPLIEIHPWAERAAIDSDCLAKQSAGAYWDFADYVHANGREIQGDKRPVNLQQAEVDRITMDMGKRHSANMADLESCIRAQSKTDLDASIKEGDGLGVQATPALFIDGMKMDGALPEEELRVVLDKELKNHGVELPAAAAKAAPGQ